MYRYINLLLIFVFALFLSSCETDFNPNAEYKDITVVYGVLNQSDTFTYIKINKAFLGNESAYVMAQNEDMSSYGTDLEVRMEEMLNGSVTNTFYFDTTTVYNKESGVFYAPKQVLYRCKTYNPEPPIRDSLKPDREYKLIIKNTKTGKIISAKTTLVGKFYIDIPTQYAYRIEFITTGSQTVEWRSATGGKKYQVNMRINYFESLNDTSHYQSKHINVPLGTITRTTLESGTTMELKYNGITYYETLKNNLAHNDPSAPQKFFRKTDKIEFTINVAGDDLSTYIDVNAPSNSIVQVRPEFTNISNGIGIFSARYNNAIDNPRTPYLGSASITILKTNYPTLGF